MQRRPSAGRTSSQADKGLHAKGGFEALATPRLLRDSYKTGLNHNSMVCLRIAGTAYSQAPVFLIHIAVWSLNKGPAFDDHGTHLTAMQTLKQRKSSHAEYPLSRMPNIGWSSYMLHLPEGCRCKKAQTGRSTQDPRDFLTFHNDLLASLHGCHHTQKCVGWVTMPVQHGAGACPLHFRSVTTIAPGASGCARSCRL